jgi:hypothetical protein
MSTNQDAISYRDKIEREIAEIEKLVGKIEQYSINKAQSKSAHERAIAIYILKLKSGIIRQWEYEPGKSIPTEGLAATDRIPIAKGMAWQESYEFEESEALYKGLIVQIEARRAILNGYQSINKVLQ